MTKQRLEAFSDAIIAIIMTIMVLEFKIPHSAEWAALRQLVPSFFTYFLSFLFLGIYWNNHHHMLHTVSHVNGKILWANLHLLFWLSLIPFVTGWMGENHYEQVPAAVYSLVLLLAGIAYYVLELTIIASQGPNSKLKAAVGSEIKAKLSIVSYVVAIALSFVNAKIALIILILVAMMWLIPDRRIEALEKQDHR